MCKHGKYARKMVCGDFVVHMIIFLLSALVILTIAIAVVDGNVVLNKRKDLCDRLGAHTELIGDTCYGYDNANRFIVLHDFK
jgi:hypothetical protein